MILMFALILLHAVSTKQRVSSLASIAGFMIFGVFLECLGYFSPPSGTHLHAKHYHVWLTHFLPLKEVLLYPIIIYPAWCAAKSLQCRSRVFEFWFVWFGSL